MLSLTDLSRDALTRANNLVSKVAVKAVRPIYRNVGLRPDHLGTVTFVTVDGHDYILTAAHVIDHHAHHTLFIGHRRLQDLTLTFHTTVAPDGHRALDRWDFSFALADPEWRRAGIEPLNISDVPPFADFITAVGYPNSANKKLDHQRHTISPTQRRYSGVRLPADHALYFELHLSSDTHVAISYPKKHVSNGARASAFEPRGMSGGIFFALPDVWKSGTILGGSPTIYPSGLITEKSTKHQALFGPALSVVAAKIRATTQT